MAQHYAPKIPMTDHLKTKLAEYTAAAAKSYEDIDHELAKALAEARGKGKK